MSDSRADATMALVLPVVAAASFRRMTPVLTSVLRCPECGHSERLEMAADSCVVFHVCGGCGVVMRPEAEDCCVFCSYGSVPCPPMQLAGRGSCPPPIELDQASRNGR